MEKRGQLNEELEKRLREVRSLEGSERALTAAWYRDIIMAEARWRMTIVKAQSLFVRG